MMCVLFIAYHNLHCGFANIYDIDSVCPCLVQNYSAVLCTIPAIVNMEVLAMFFFFCTLDLARI